MRRKKGFTLAELLIVVAIIAVLVAIAIPIFTNHLEKSRESVDLANARSAYAEVMTAAISEDSSSGIKQGDSYQIVLKPLKQTKNGWTTNMTGMELGGVPYDDWIGSPRAKGSCTVKFNAATGVVSINWGGEYAGLNVTNQQQYKNLSYEERVERDLVLLDGLQNEFRNMTYGQIHELFYDEDNKLKSAFSGKSLTGDSNQALVQSLNGNMCVTIAESTIVNGKVEPDETYHNTIYLSEMFQNAGYSISEETTENYILNSVNSDGTNSNGKNARLWVNLGISQDELKKLDSNSPLWNQKAGQAYTYLKGAGLPTDSAVSQAQRSQQ